MINCKHGFIAMHCPRCQREQQDERIRTAAHAQGYAEGVEAFRKACAEYCTQHFGAGIDGPLYPHELDRLKSRLTSRAAPTGEAPAKCRCDAGYMIDIESGWRVPCSLCGGSGRLHGGEKR